MTQLIRNHVLDLYNKATNAHPGLILDRGWSEFTKTNSENADTSGKTKHLERLCHTQPSELYYAAYHRWKNLISAENVNPSRFCHVIMRVRGRLLVGLSGGGALETGCSISQSYGMPFIAGSSIKGITRAYAESTLANRMDDVIRELFGQGTDTESESGLAGLVTFHDAWWVPDDPLNTAQRPFALDTVTSHHPAYYSTEGQQAPTDFDSPIPNALVGVTGRFLFTLEGPQAWTEQAKLLLIRALEQRGIGAKTQSGYGYFECDQKFIEEEEDAKKQKLCQKQEEEEAKRLSALPPFEQQLALLLKDRDQQVPEYKFLLKKLKEGFWKDESESKQIAQRIKNAMIDAKKWREKTQKKNPAKDDDYQNTLIVLRYL